ncbi:fungal pheromone mating factor STE2 GPCR-domain-containing protein [Aspergillus unguis]
MTTMNSTFDPWAQKVIFHDADGSPFEVPIHALDEWVQYPIKVCINYASQLGASVILLVILLLLTRAEKRASYVFWLNCSALILNFARLLCSMLMFTSSFMNVYAYFAEDYSHVSSGDYANSVMGVVFAALLQTVIEISLVLQVQVVCSNFRRTYRRVLLGLSIIIATVPIAFRYWLAIVNIRGILDATSPVPFHWLERAGNICLTVSICYFCTVFVTKLGFAIRLRRKLGLHEFGPTKVIFIMGCQTMVIPAILAVVHNVTDVPELSTNVLTLVALSLPLSSIWASTTLSRPSTSSNFRNFWQILSFSGKNSFATSTTSTARQCTHCYSDSRPLTEKDKDEKSKNGSTTASESSSTTQYGIAVAHDISVESARRDSLECV